MPQLDTASFFTQYVWLCVCYVGFYLTLVKYFLPKLARVTKLRSYKVHTPTETSVEAQELHTAGEACVVASVKHARTVCAEHFTTTTAWVNDVVANHTHSSVTSAQDSVHALSALHHSTLKDSATVLHPRAYGNTSVHGADYGLYLLKVALLVKKAAGKTKKKKA